MGFLGCVVCKKGLAGSLLVCTQWSSNRNCNAVRWDPVRQRGVILDQSSHFTVKAFSRKVFVLVLYSHWNRQVCLIDDVLLSHRTAAIKALNATGQHNINFDTLFKVFLKFCIVGSSSNSLTKQKCSFIRDVKAVPCCGEQGLLTAQLSLGELKTESCSKCFWTPILGFYNSWPIQVESAGGESHHLCAVSYFKDRHLVLDMVSFGNWNVFERAFFESTSVKWSDVWKRREVLYFILFLS